MARYWYGIRSGVAISIEDVPTSMKGLACECVCPYCRRAFEACALSENSKRDRYFRHQKNPSEDRTIAETLDCEVDWANESGLHLMAKQVIQTYKQVMLPIFEITPQECGLPEEILEEISPEHYYRSTPTVFTGTSVILESSVSGFKPDITLKNDKYELFVEIRVNHRVDTKKLEKVQAYAKAHMIEIDLRDFAEKPVNEAELAEFLCKSTESRKWLFHPHYEEAITQATEYYKKLPSVAEYYRKAEQRERGKKKLERLFSQPDAYAFELRRLRYSDQELKQVFQKKDFSDFWFWAQTHTVPFFVDIPITGEMVFQCDRRVWQSVVFDRYIFNRTTKRICVNNVFHELHTTHDIPVDWELAYSQEIDAGSFSLSLDVIKQYFDHLAFLGFISYINDRWPAETWAAVQCAHSITPPNSNAAEYLKETLQKIELSNPFIDSELINAEIDFRRRERVEAERKERIRKEAEEKALQEAIKNLKKCDFKIREPLVCPDQVPRYQCEDCEEIKEINDFFVYDKAGRRGLCSACMQLRILNCDQIRSAFEQQPVLKAIDPSSIFSLKEPLFSVNRVQVFQCRVCSFVGRIHQFANDAERDDQNRVCLSCWNLYKRAEARMKHESQETDAKRIARELLAGRKQSVAPTKSPYEENGNVQLSMIEKRKL